MDIPADLTKEKTLQIVTEIMRAVTAVMGDVIEELKQEGHTNLKDPMAAQKLQQR